MTTPDLDVLHLDDHLLVLNKPSGLLVHRGWGRDDVTLIDLVKDYLDAPTAYPIHRLDRPTSGVVLFARDPQTARLLNDAFDDRRPHKTYLALVRGASPPDGTIDHPIPRREDGPRVPALSRYRTLITLHTEPRHTSLVEVHPETGRLHQVRRHLKHIHHPLIGDSNYGKGRLNRAFAERYGLQRLALHAAALTLTHPATGDPAAFTAPLPPDLLRPLALMGLPLPDACSLAQLHAQLRAD